MDRIHRMQNWQIILSILEILSVRPNVSIFSGLI